MPPEPNKPAEGHDVQKYSIRDLWSAFTNLSIGSLIFVFGFLSTLVGAAIAVDHFIRPGGLPPVEHPLLAEGRRSNQSYVLPSIVSWIRLEAERAGFAPSWAEQRITYDVWARSDITSDDDVFEEGYNSSNADLTFVSGTDHAGNFKTIHGLEWVVPLRMKAGDFRSVVTGVHRAYHPGWSEHARTSHAGDTLMNNQDEFCYENSAKDVIGELTVLVESSTLTFKSPLAGTTAYRLRGKDRSSMTPEVRGVEQNALPSSTAMARFGRPSPDEVDCLVLAW